MAFKDDDVMSSAEDSGFQHTDSEFFKKTDVDVFWDVIFKQLRYCCSEGSKEMTTGGVVTRYINGVVIDINLPNQREIFNNSVFMLKTLLTKFFNNKNNESYKEQIDKSQKSYDENKEKIILSDNNLEIKELKRIILKTSDSSKRDNATRMYNDILKTNKKQLEELETEYSKQVLTISVELMDREKFGKPESAMAME